MTEVHRIRKFGCIFTFISGGLLAGSVWKGSFDAMLVFSLLLILGFGFAVLPSAMAPIYQMWLEGFLFFGKVMAVILLTILFYGMITPCALIIRWLRGPLFPLKPSKDADSYWKLKKNGMQSAERFHKRY